MTSLVSLCILVLQVIVQHLSLIPFTVQAELIEDYENGSLEINFLSNPRGIASIDPGINHNTTAGTIQLGTGTSGSFTLVEIDAISLDTWDELRVDLQVGNTNDVSIDIYDCDGGVLGSNLPLVGGAIDLTPYNSSTCIQPTITIASGSPSPVISNIGVTREPKPYLLLDAVVIPEVDACQEITYQIRYALSYVNEKDVVIRAPLPAHANGGYSQDLTPEFINAEQDGIYTDVPINITTIGGKSITVPANSVYWYFDELQAGDTGILAFSIKSPCGTQNGVTYTTIPYSESNRTNQQSGEIGISSIQSEPNATLTKTSTNTFTFDSTTYAYLPVISGIIDYQITVKNGTKTNVEKDEDLFNSSIIDDLSNITNTIDASCSGGNLSTRILNISTGGVYNDVNSIITRDFDEVFDIGSTDTVTYSIDYSGCEVDGLEFINTAELSADNLNSLTKEHTVRVLDTITPTGLFYKSINGPKDTSLHRVGDYFYDEVIPFYIGIYNPGIVTINDHIFMDKVPTDMNLAAPIELPTGVNGYVFYSTTTTAPDPTTPPSYDETNADSGTLGSGWSTTFNADATWFSIYLECVDAASNSAPVSNNHGCYQASNNIDIEVLMVFPETNANDVCTTETRDNIANWLYHSAAPNPSNTGKKVYTGASFSDYPPRTAIVHPKVADITIDPGKFTGIPTVQAGEAAVYNLILTNSGADSSTDTVVRFDIPDLIVNGSVTYPSAQVLNAAGLTIDTTNLPSALTVHAGLLSPGETKDITIQLNTPSGVVTNTDYTLTAHIETNDNICNPQNFILQTSTTILSSPILSTYKTRDRATILPTEQVEYEFFINNRGNGIATDAFFVDILPEDINLLEANTFSGSGCVGCKVYFAPEGRPDLPLTISPLEVFDPALIYSNFTLGVDSNGVWIPPTGMDARYIAVKLDNPDEGGFKAGGLASFSFLTEDDGHIVGDIIRNYGAVLSNQNLQGISNQVTTTIIEFPGLDIDIYSSKDIVEMCEDFNWIVDYNHNGSDANTETIITINLPNTVSLDTNSISHTWDTEALGGGASPTTQILNETQRSGGQLIDGSREVVVDINTLRASNLFPNEGGTFALPVTSVCSGLDSGEILVATTQGDFENTLAAGMVDDTDPVTVFNADMSIIKLVNQLTPLPSEIINYTLTVANAGFNDAYEVSLYDTLPIGMCYIPNTTVSRSLPWIIAEPTVMPDPGTNPCDGTFQQTLYWTYSGGNTLYHSTNSGRDIGYVPAQSENIYIAYDTQVLSFIPDGTDLTNGAAITTSTPEDDYTNNNDDTTVTTPHPDPTVVIDTPYTLLPDEVFSYDITYRNLSRKCSPDTFLVHALPDVTPPPTGDGDADVTLNSVYVTTGNVYYHDGTIGSGALDAITPVFDPLNPLSNGWSTTQTTPTNYVALYHGELCDSDGVFTMTLNATARQSDGSQVGIGITMPFDVEIDNSTVDTNENNNYSIDELTVPSIDLWIDIIGDPEGAYPGNVPNGSQDYEVNFGNQGTSPSCDNRIQITLDPNLSPLSPLTNFGQLNLVDSNGDPVDALNTSGVAITNSSLLNVSMVSLGGGVYEFTLGNPAANVCIPAGAQSSFDIFAQVKGNVTDGTSIVTQADIGEEDINIEEITLSNNHDDAQTVVYLADLVIQKAEIEYIPQEVCNQTVIQTCSVMTGADAGMIATVDDTCAEAHFLDPGVSGICTLVGATTMNDCFTWFDNFGYFTVNNTYDFTVAVHDAWGGAYTPTQCITTSNIPRWEYRHPEDTGSLCERSDGAASTGTLINCPSGASCINPDYYTGPQYEEVCETVQVATSITTTEPGDVITYTVEYNNRGNTSAVSSIITDYVPEESCLDTSSVEDNLPVGATVTYYNSVGASVSPIGVDCQVRSFDVNLGTLTSPATFDGESCSEAEHVKLLGNTATNRYGSSVVDLGDLDGDGVIDIAVGEYLGDTSSTNAGIIYVHFMNVDGSIKSTQEISGLEGGGPPYNGGLYGNAIDTLGDLDSDGVVDIVVGAQNRFYIHYMNTDGTLDASRTKEHTASSIPGFTIPNGVGYGVGVVGLGDLDGTGPGVAAVAVAANDFDSMGAVFIHILDVDGNILSTKSIDSNTPNGPILNGGAAYGYGGLAFLGDLDGAGPSTTALAVTVVNNDIGGNNRGAVYIHFLDESGDVLSTEVIAHETGGGPSLTNGSRYGAAISPMGDINGDGITDLAVAARGAGKLFIHTMNRDGTIASTQEIAKNDIAGGSGAWGRWGLAELGDLDQNGITDIAISDRADSNTAGSQAGAVYIFNRDGTTLGASMDRSSCQFDGTKNGVDDRLASTTLGEHAGPADRIILDSPTAYISTELYADNTPNDIMLLDYNLDGNLDIAYKRVKQNQQFFYQGNGDGTFTEIPLLLNHPNPTFKPVYIYRSLLTGDFNDDGMIDLAYHVDGSDTTQDGYLHVFLATSTGFTSHEITNHEPYNSTRDAGHVADVNGDGFDDLLYGESYANNYSVIAYSQGDGSFVVTTGDYGIHSTLLPGDFDGDGDIDIYNGNIMRNDGNVGSTDPFSRTGVSSIVQPISPLLIAQSSSFVDDVDNNGIDDLILKGSNGGNAKVCIVLNGDATCQEIYNEPGGSIGATYMGDFNGDGNKDILVGNNSNLVSLLLGNGDGTFSAPITQPEMTLQRYLGSGPLEDVFDINNDGMDDVIENHGNIRLSNGSGFDLSYQIPFSETNIVETHSEIRVEDLNNDGQNDFVAFHTNAADLWTYVYPTNSYLPSGTYQTPIEATQEVTAWGRLLLTQNKPTDTEITYEIRRGNSTCSSLYTNPGILIGPSTTENGIIDISSLDPAISNYCLKVTMTTEDTSVTPELDSWVATYISPEDLTFEFDVHVQEGADLQGVDNIHNDISIRTSTPETNYANNEDDHTHIFALTDLSIDKQVDLASAQVGDTLTYTLTYENSGPNDATGVMIIDTIPTQLDINSAVGWSLTPDSINTGTRDVTRDLGLLTAYATGEITFSIDLLTGLAANAVATNPVHIETETLEADYTNNDDSATTVIGTYANVYTTISCSPKPALLGGEADCTITRGNNGASATTGGDLTVVLDPDFIFDESDPSSITGLPSGTTCRYNVADGNYSSHYLVCTGGTFTDMDPGFSDEFNISGGITTNPDLLDDLVTFEPGRQLEFETIISTTTAETTNSDNFDDDTIPVVLGQLSSIEGTVYVDLFDEEIGIYESSYNPSTDLLLEDIEVCLIGTNFLGYSVGADEEYNIPCVTTDIDGNYSFPGLYPGNYEVYYIDSSVDYDSYYSVGGIHDLTRDTVNGFTGDPTGAGSINNNNIATNSIVSIALETDDHATQENFALMSSNLYISANYESTLCLASGYTLEIDYGNNGTKIANNATIVLDIPTNWSVLDISHSGSGCTNNGNTIDCLLGDLDVDTVGTVVIEYETPENSQYIVSNEIFTIDMSIASDHGEVQTTDNFIRDASIDTILCSLGSIAGSIYIDNNGDYTFDAIDNDYYYTQGVEISLSGTSISGVVISEILTTDMNGNYLFSDLLPGDYSVSYSPLVDYIAHGSTAGYINGSQVGEGWLEDDILQTTEIKSITLGEGGHSRDNDFMLIDGDVSIMIECSPDYVYWNEEITCTVTYTNSSIYPAENITINTKIADDLELTSFPSFCVGGSLDCFSTGITLQPETTNSYIFTLNVLTGTDTETILKFPTEITTSIPGDVLSNNTDNDEVTLLGHVPYCGDGDINSYYGTPIIEVCDDGNNDDNDGCDALCHLESCGDNVLQTTEDCELIDGEIIRNEHIDSAERISCVESMCKAKRTGGSTVSIPLPKSSAPKKPSPACGNRKLEGNEECDDGNNDNNDTCSNTCHIKNTKKQKEYCGDGIVQVPNQDGIIEECDGEEGCGDTCTWLPEKGDPIDDVKDRVIQEIRKIKGDFHTRELSTGIGTQEFIVPQKHPQMGLLEEDIISYLAEEGIGIDSQNTVVDTSTHHWIDPIDSTSIEYDDLGFWLNKIPKEYIKYVDDAKEFIVIPDAGIVAPIVEPIGADREALQQGKDYGFDTASHLGVMRYPGSAEIDNFGRGLYYGHSSNLVSNNNDFGRIFKTLALADVGDKIFIFRKNNTDGFDKYTYTITDEERIPAHQTDVMHQEIQGKHIALITCVDIGTSDDRYIIYASQNIDITYNYTTITTQIPDFYRDRIDLFLDRIKDNDEEYLLRLFDKLIDMRSSSDSALSSINQIIFKRIVDYTLLRIAIRIEI